MNRHVTILLFRPFEHREFGYPQNIVNVFIYKPVLVGNHKTDSAEGIEHDVIFIRREEQNVSFFEVHSRLDVFDIFRR